MRELRRFDTRDLTVREIAYPAGARQPRHEHDYGNITAVIGGEVIERADEGEYRGRSCSVVVKPAQTPHAMEISGRATALTLSLQFARTSPFAAELGKWRWFEADDAGIRAALALHEAMRTGRAVEAYAHDFALHVLGACSRSADLPVWFVELCSILDRDFAEPLRFDVLSRRLGLHPVYVSRAFRRHAGMSMGDYVRALRLREARHLLASTRRSAAAIALDTGFADGSHFARLFSRAIGITPSEYRRRSEV
jgi:AraC family transcriptional regulator